MEEGNDTRRTQRAAAGAAKAIRTEHVKPDTLIMGPEGKMLVLGRRRETDLLTIPGFEKFNPAKRGQKKGAKSLPPLPRVMTPAAVAAAAKAGGGNGGTSGLLQGPLGIFNRIPLMNVIVTAALLHRVYKFVVRRFFGGANNGGAGSGSGRQGSGARGGRQQQQQRQLTKYGEGANGEEEYDELDEMDERAEELLEQMRHTSMLPTMLRASLPRPQRTNLAKRAAQQHHSRPRGYRTAHQMMHAGPAPPGALKPGSAGGAGAGSSAGGGVPGRRQAQRRPLGKLEKMDLIVRQQVRATMLAQQQQQHEEQRKQLLQSCLEGPSGGVPLALPAPGAARASAGAPARYSAPQHASQLQQNGHGHSAGGQLALAGRPSAGSGGLSSALSHLPPPMPVPPPAFRPLPPDLLARMRGAPRPGAAEMSPAARSVAAGPPPPLAVGVSAGTGAGGSGGAGSVGAGRREGAQGQGQAENGGGLGLLESAAGKDGGVEVVNVPVPRLPRRKR